MLEILLADRPCLFCEIAPRICFNLMLEILLADRESWTSNGLPSGASFNLMLEILLADRWMPRIMMWMSSLFQSHA